MSEANRNRVLGIVGSPRRGGNTEILVDEVLRGAEEAGALVEKIILSERNIAPCRACMACGKTGKCLQQDDMPALLEQMLRSQVWVLGTPVYYWGPTAQFKAFLDRWFSRIRELFETRKGRRVILAIPLEAKDADAARHTVGILTETLDWLKMEVFATLVAPGVWDAGAIREHPDILTAARRAGRDAIRDGEEKLK